jgi:hypothetical protein
MNDYIFYHNNGSLCSNHNRGEQSWLYHIEGKRDRIVGAAHQFAPLHPSLRSICRVQTGGYSIGIDTFDNQNYLCHNDKSFESCCILGIQSDMISS